MQLGSKPIGRELSFLSCRGFPLWENSKQIAQIGFVCGVTQKRRHAEDLFEGAEGGTMGIVNRVLEAISFGKRRYDDHADRTVSGSSFVPGDEHRAAVEKGG